MAKASHSSGDPNQINAEPTKELFISMLVRDLTIEDAIGDLVDNCVDGAKASRPDKKYDGLWVKITVNSQKFKIEDNCGGMSAEIARNYAFRFGRKEGSERISGSVGNFGIGMKRSLFKLGNNFEVESTWKKSYFKINVDVNQWRSNPDWVFSFNSLNEIKTNPSSKLGTKLEVTGLKNDVAAQFGNKLFIDKLKREIELENLYNIHNGLKITINNEPLTARQIHLMYSNDFQPAYHETSYQQNGDTVNVRIIAGISEENQDEGGWYVFCNERLILGPDQTSVTGWGDGAAKYHHQYQRFRGIVNFESDNADALPWNTTKNGLDKTSAIFQNSRQKMIEMMKSVIGFLNKLKDERVEDNPKENWVLYNRLAEATLVPIFNLNTDEAKETFTFPAISTVKASNPEISVSFKKSRKDVEKVKSYFKTSSAGEAGKKAFDYFMEMEIE